MASDPSEPVPAGAHPAVDARVPNGLLRPAPSRRRDRRGPEKPSRRRGAIILIASLLVVVLVLAIVAAVVLGQRRTSNGMLVDLARTPTESAWSVSGLSLPGGIQALGRVDRDRSLFFAPAADGVGDGELLLLDSQSRSIVWSVTSAPPQQEGSPVQLVTTDPITVNTTDGVVALDPSSGRVLSRTTGAVAVVGGDLTGARPDLDGDLVLQRGSMLERVAAKALTKPRWTVNTTASDFVLGTDAVVSGSTAFSVETGRSISWAGKASDEDVVVGGHVLARRGAFGDASATWALLDDATGRTVTTFTSDDGDFVGYDEKLYVVQRGSTAHAYDVATGAERWTAPASASTNSAIVLLPRPTGVIPLLTLDSATEVQIADAASGRPLYRLRTASTSIRGASVQVVGAGRRTLYLQDGAQVRALGLRNGEQLWTLTVHKGAAVLPVGDRLVVIDGSRRSIASLTD